MADVTRYVNTASAGGDGTTNGESGANAAYVSLSAWNAAEAKNLVVAAETHEVLCDVGSGSAADTTLFTTGFTTNSIYYFTIRANPSGVGGDQRATTEWSATKYRMQKTTSGSGTLMQMTEDGNFVQDLQFEVYNADNTTSETFAIYFATTANNCVVERCYLRLRYNRNFAPSGAYIGAFNLQADNVTFRNCICDYIRVGSQNPTICSGITNQLDETGNVLQNCTFFSTVTGSFLDVVRNTLSGSGYVTITNCLSQQWTWGDTADAASDYNAGNLTGAPGSNSIDSATFTFVSASDRALDTTDESGADDGGFDLSASFTDDIVRATRTAPWSIGAFELDIGGGGDGGTHELTQTISVSTFSVGPIIVQPVDTDS